MTNLFVANTTDNNIVFSAMHNFLGYFGSISPYIIL